VLLQKLAKKGKKVKLLDESASVKELPRQEDLGDGEDQRRRRNDADKFGGVEELNDDRDDIDEDDMGGNIKMQTKQNFLTVEEQE